MLDHLSLGVSNLVRAISFYDGVLAPLGYVRRWLTEQGAGYRARGREDQVAVLATRHRPKVEGFHIALVARSQSEVDAFHAAALLLGGTSEIAPGLRDGYYAAFVRDPDGLVLEALCYR